MEHVGWNSHAEWLEVDGWGGFASGTVNGRRTRRYHALLLVAQNPPADRFVLVNGLETWVETSAGSFPLSSQYYSPGVVHPHGAQFLVNFSYDPLPMWTFLLPDGTRLVQEWLMPHGCSALMVRWRLVELGQKAVLTTRPLLSGRDYHQLHHENSDFRFQAQVQHTTTNNLFGGTETVCKVEWQPYPHVPQTVVWSNGQYVQEPLWYRQFLYAEERYRGLDYEEDLASPGYFRHDLSESFLTLVLTTPSPRGWHLSDEQSLTSAVQEAYNQELDRRRWFASTQRRASECYTVRRGDGATILAGYPWFTDWGRDTFIALRGLCLATAGIDNHAFHTAQQILSDWSGTVSQGMLPNRFPDHGSEPEFNSVDASLWFIVAVYEFLQVALTYGIHVPDDVRSRLVAAVESILSGYTAGTRFQIQVDTDGLLRAGQAGVQLTWMDAKVGDWVVTPRIGKPVEVNALWVNALWIGQQLGGSWETAFQLAKESFRRRFWNEQAEQLFDVIDVDHLPGNFDGACRPNQIFAVGGLPLMLLDLHQAQQVVQVVEEKLLTPLGLRSLAPDAPDYRPWYGGDVWQRDGAYHQGTVWLWLLGPFVEAWLRVRNDTLEARREARQKFIEPLWPHFAAHGLGHLSEIADGDYPHTPRGCPFQAWSLGEYLRLTEWVLADSRPAFSKENNP